MTSSERRPSCAISDTVGLALRRRLVSANGNYVTTTCTLQVRPARANRFILASPESLSEEPVLSPCVIASEDRIPS